MNTSGCHMIQVSTVFQRQEFIGTENKRKLRKLEKKQEGHTQMRPIKIEQLI